MNITNDWLNVTGAASKVAKIKIHGVIGGDWFEEGVTAEQVERDLEDIAEIKASTIQVDLDSLGGSVKHGMKIYNLLKSNSANIEVNITGWTASMGTVIAMAADKDKLKMVDNNHFLVHEARTWTAGTKAQLEADAKFLDNINNDIANIYSERTGLSKVDALALMGVNGGEGEFWNAKETLSKGFIDSTYKPEKGATASITQEQLNEFKINAKINLKQKQMFDLTKIKANVEKVYNAFIGALSDEEKKEAKNLEAGRDKAIESVVDMLEENVNAFKEEKEAELTAKTTELSDLQAKYDVLKAGDSNATGKDAYLGGDANLTDADKAANELKASLSDADKAMFDANKK